MVDLDVLAKGLTDGERSRLLDGRTDWRTQDWQDHCGDLECEHCFGIIPSGQPNLLSERDAALRAHLKDIQDG